MDRESDSARLHGAGREGDPALNLFVLMLKFRGIAADAESLRHKMGADGAVSDDSIVRCARQLGLKAGLVRTRWDALANKALPGLLCLKDGGFLLIAKLDANQALVQLGTASAPSLMSRSDIEAAWNGKLILMSRRAGISDLSRRFDIGWFLGAIKKYRHHLGEVLVASFFLQIFALVTPLFFQVIIDKVLVHRTTSTLTVLIVALIAIAVFESVIGFLRIYTLSHTTNRIDVELGARLFRHLLALPLAYFQARRVGDSVARVRELENIRNFLTSSALTLAIDLFFTATFLVAMFFYSSLLTLVVLASLPVYFGVSLVVTPLFRRSLDEKFRRGAENQAFLVEGVTGIETLKSMAVEPLMQRQWEEQLAGYVSSSFKVSQIGNVASQTIQLVSKLVSALILLFGANLVIDGALSVGELVAFTLLAGRVNAPVLRLAQVWQDFHQARLSIARLGDILNTAPEPSVDATDSFLPSLRGEIVFDHVGFRYQIDGAAVLSDVSFRIPAGQMTGIVGVSGSGKSTVAKLVQRLYVPTQGRVVIDGHDVANVDPASLRRQIGVVLQESVLFNRSVRDNIALADPAASMDRVIAAANLAGAHEFVSKLPHGYNTILGERGSSLSGGQRQRIALARALITDPRILILDEATSALDYESERRILENMESIARGRTVIVIAHRLSTVRGAHTIITMEDGTILECGSHDELVRTGGRYASLYRLQSGLRESA